MLNGGVSIIPYSENILRPKEKNICTGKVFTLLHEIRESRKEDVQNLPVRTGVRQYEKPG